MTLRALAVLVAAAALEVLGDAAIRRGLRGGGLAFLALGVAVLGAYGVLVNLPRVDFSRQLGVYVGVFALASVLVGRLVFHEKVVLSTWAGLALILAGSAIIQLRLGDSL